MLARKISENRLRDKYGLRKNELKRREGGDGICRLERLLHKDCIGK